MKICYAITFHYVEEKLKNLERVLKSLSSISADESKTIISVNDISQEQYTKIKNLCQDTTTVIHPVRRLYHPYFLAWNHKHWMLEFLRGDFDYFVYLEDDVELTNLNMEYWIETRNKFCRNNLNFIPGLLRIEYDNRGNPYAVDIFTQERLSSMKKITVEGSEYVQLSRPYQASFIMDRILVEEHIYSPYFRYETSMPFEGAWLVQDLAAQGNMFHDVPSGWQHRHLVPTLNNEVCWVHHNTDTYVNMPESRHGKIPADLIFI